jgi:hypothetical protein
MAIKQSSWLGNIQEKNSQLRVSEIEMACKGLHGMNTKGL